MFDITVEELFTKTKKRTSVDARQLLYYMCVRQGIELHYLITWCGEYDFKLNYSSLVNALRYMDKRIVDDRDYIRIIKDMESKLIPF